MPQTYKFEKLAKQDVRLLRIWHQRLLRNWSQIKTGYQNGARHRPINADELTTILDGLARRGFFTLDVLNPPKRFRRTWDTASYC
jgi:hypothetical protein